MTEQTTNRVLAFLYPNEWEATSAANQIEAMVNDGSIEASAGAVVTREEQSGKVRVKEYNLTPAKGAKRGLGIGVAIGILFPPSILAAGVIGAAVGALAGEMTYEGLGGDNLRELGEELEPGDTVVLVVTTEESGRRITDAVDGYVRVETHDVGD